MNRTSLAFRVLLVPVLLLALASQPAAASGKAGWVEVWITDHRAGIGDFQTLSVEIAEVSLHRRGQPRGTGWVQLFRTNPVVDIVPLKDGRSAMVAGGLVETVSYDAVRVRFGLISGKLQRGGSVNVVPIGSTIAVDLAVESGKTRFLLIDLYVEDRSEHQPAQYAIKVQDVRVGTH